MSLITKSGSSGNLQDVNSRKAALVASADTDAPTYIESVAAKAMTAQGDIIAIESGAVKVTRIRRVIITHCGSQTSAGIVLLQLVRTTTPGAAGVVVPQIADGASSDPAFSGIVRSSPTSLGTASVVLFQLPLFVPTLANIGPFTPQIYDMDALGLAKSMSIPVGVANGIAFRHPGAAGAANLGATIIFTEEST